MILKHLFIICIYKVFTVGNVYTLWFNCTITKRVYIMCFTNSKYPSYSIGNNGSTVFPLLQVTFQNQED